MYAIRSYYVRDWQGAEHPFLLGPENPAWVPLKDLPEELPWAVIVAEDANFYTHFGFDPEAIREALVYDLKQKRLARGASTITQQLAKNLYLTRDKTFSRKLREVLIRITSYNVCYTKLLRLQPKCVIPIHYNTFDLLNQDAQAWKKRVEAETATQVAVLRPGECFDF